MQEYKVVLERFEGPLDLLIHLIDNAKVSIYDIPIKEITDQYIEYLNKIKIFDLEAASEFLIMASTLLEIKSKMLLPANDKNKGTQMEMEEVDPRLELVQKLVEYKKYKEVSSQLKYYEEIQNKVYYKLKDDLNDFEEEKDKIDELNIDDLVQALNNIIKRKNKKKNKILNINEIQREELPLEECIKKIRGELQKKSKIKFSFLIKDDVSNSYIVTKFLAILEMTKSKEIKIKQNEDFSDILIMKIQDYGG